MFLLALLETKSLISLMANPIDEPGRFNHLAPNTPYF